MLKKQLVNKIAMYMRLSKDDGDKEESESITNQRAIIREYIEKNFEYKYIEEYIDDGFTGANFNRPSFQRMLKEIKNNEIDIVITKNLARFGRSYIDLGDFIEKVFPNNNTRYIAILDNVDNYEDNISNDFSPIKGVFNEMFCKETSRAVKKTKREKMQTGYYACNTPPFGYNKSIEVRGLLVIDPPAAKIVKMIFEMKADGKTNKEICEYLNAQNIPTPSVYRDIKGLEKVENKHIWRVKSVQKILSNQVYLGHCIRGKTQNISYKSKKRLHIRREDCIITKNTHEAIITQEIFDKVHTKRFGTTKKESTLEILLDGLIYCNICGKKMTKRRDRKKITMTCVRSWDSKELCSNDNRYNYEELEKQVINKIIECYDEHINFKKMEDKLLNTINKKNTEDLKIQQDTLSNELKRIRFKISKLYTDRLLEEISETEYLESYNLLTNERKNKTEELEKIENKIQNYKESSLFEKNKKEIKQALHKIKKGEFTKDEIEQLINKIRIDKDNIIIDFKYINNDN